LLGYKDSGLKLSSFYGSEQLPVFNFLAHQIENNQWILQVNVFFNKAV
jgi:hypothetical protein